ncbi:MAG: hypothetical protein KatS3mg027_0514 [Bacteroidia bacterium]|nr:MAG: hypothetical protein KatS3mg027_0514 [Bacteroidia bacterium]
MNTNNEHTNQNLNKAFESEEYLSQFHSNEKDIKSFFEHFDANNIASKFESEEYFQQFQPDTTEWYIFEKIYLNRTNFITKNILFDLLALIIFFNLLPLSPLFNHNLNINPSKNINASIKNNYSNNPSLSTQYNLTNSNSEKKHPSNALINNNTHKNINPPTYPNINTNSISSHPNASHKTAVSTQSHKKFINNISTSSSIPQHQKTINNSLITQTNPSNTTQNNHNNYSTNSSQSPIITDNSIHSNNIDISPLPLISIKFLTKDDTNYNLLTTKNFDALLPQKTTHFLFFYTGITYNFGYSKSNGKGLTPTFGLNYTNNFLHPKVLLGTGINYTSINHINTLLPISIAEKYDFGFSKDTTYLQYNQLHFLLLPINFAYLSKYGIFSTALNIKYLLYSNSNVMNRKVSSFAKEETSSSANNYITGLNQWNYGFSISYQIFIFKNFGLQLTYYQDLQPQQKNNYTFSSHLNKNKFISLNLLYDFIKKK